MKTLSLAMQLLNVAPRLAGASQATAGPSLLPFSSNFKQPTPPTIQSEFTANYNQHKWNENVSHIVSGFLYHSLSQEKVRVDGTTAKELISSIFDYNNMTASGVENRMWTITPNIGAAPQLWSGFVEPGFPLISTDFLVENNAVFRGTVEDTCFGMQSVAWNILFQGQIPATIFVDGEGIVCGYDFWSPNERTYVITRFFNIQVGEISKDVFETPGETIV